MISKEKIEAISCEVIGTLYSRFKTFPEDNSGIRNAPFHMAFLKAFQNRLEEHVTDIPVFISLSSWFHGLNTTLGQGFFEKVSHILSGGLKPPPFKNLKISHEQQTRISDIIIDLKNRKLIPNRIKENQLIFKQNGNLDKNAQDFTADCFFEDEKEIIAIEIKTVNPNSGVSKNEKEKILSAKAALKNLFADKEVYYYLGFPFDPYSDSPTGYDKERFIKNTIELGKFFAPDEILLADELWNFLSGDSNTMQQLIDIINCIATPKFLEKYKFLDSSNNRITNNVEYTAQLKEWNLFSESLLTENEQILKQRISGNNNMIRKFNQPIFHSGKYNSERYVALEKFIH